MKRNDDEKISGKPMFPRLHVNDTEKGGPRAPPRNKMALYEQLSTPSQRFNHGVLPLNPNSNSNMGSALERSMFLPRHIYSPTATRIDEESRARGSNDSNTSAPLIHIEQGSEVGEEDDLQVPVFVHAEQVSSQGHNPIQEMNGQSRESSKDSDGCMLNTDHSVKSPRRKRNELSKGVDSFSGIEHQDHLVGNLSRFQENDCSRKQSEENGNEYPGDQMCGSRPVIDLEKCDDVSEASMVDSMSELDISPDDVVGIIGQKRFWKARKTIVNQQRLFAVQVFELHKLIKVQKLIAGSPHLLHEDSVYLENPSLKGSPSPVKELPEYAVRPTPLTMKRKNVTEKVNNKTEHSAENAVVRSSACAISGTHLEPVAVDNTGPRGFQPPPGQQWLVPVMTPSEGLVYKLYPGPEFSGTGCGGGRPFGPPSFPGNFMAPGYGVSPYNHQGMGFIPNAPPIGHGYFSPYGMPVMNAAFPGPSVEQKNRLAGPVPSTASCPGEGTETGLTAEGRDSIPCRPPWIAPAAQEPQAVPQARDNNGGHPTQVIRVVPHNPRSASESAARIFQSIQKERKQQDSV